MLFNWIIAPVLSFLTAVIGYLPTGSWSPGVDASAVAVNMRSWANTAQAFVPLGLMADGLYVTVFFIGPAILVYAIAQWGYKELPHIFGWGS